MEMNRDAFISSGSKALEAVYDTLESLKEISLDELDPYTTAMISVDMINGFAKEGALYSPRVKALIPQIAELIKACGNVGIPHIAFADAHPEDSPEFSYYPPHCMTGSVESELVEELKSAGPYTRIQKNSTNGFLEPEFQAWMHSNDQLDTFIVVGDCTDICIEQFATTLKCSFNRINRPVRVVVPVNMVDTYDLGTHNGDLMHATALMMLIGNGVEVVRGIIHE